MLATPFESTRPMPSSPRGSRHRRYHSYDNPIDHPGFSQLLTTVLGSPFLTTADLPSDTELVDGMPLYVPNTQTVTRPPSPTPTVDSTTFSFVQYDPDAPRPPFKSILPRIWQVLSPGARTPPHSFSFSPSASPFNYPTYRSKGKGRQYDGSESGPRYIDYSDLPPLDGEEGELIAIDDEACFFIEAGYGSRAVTGIDILALLPTELALYILINICTAESPQSNISNTTALDSTNLSPPHSPLPTVLACLAVSKTWHILAADNTVWRALFLSRWIVDLTRPSVHGPFHAYIPLPTLFQIHGEPASPRTISPKMKIPMSMAVRGTPSKMRMTKKRAKHFLAGRSMDATFSSLSSSPADPRTPRQKVPNHPFSFSPPSRSPRSIASPSAPSSPISSPSTPLVYLPDPSPTNLAHAPLQLNWYSLYRDRLELEKRWAGTAAALPSATPDSSPSTPPYPAYPHTLVPAPLASHPSLENAMPCQPPPTPSPAPAQFAPQVLSIEGHTDSVYCLEFDSQRIITGSRDRTIKVWSLQGRLLGSFGGVGAGAGEDVPAQGHTGSVLCLKFSADWDRDGAGEGGQRAHGDGNMRRGFMVSGSSDCSVCVWDLYTGRNLGSEGGSEEKEVHAEVRAVLKGHAGGVLDLRIDEQWIVSCSKDAVIRVWDRKTLELSRTLRGHEGPVNAVGLQSGKVVSASGDGKMILWDIKSGERIRTFEGHDRGLACIEFKDDVIVSGSNDCKIKVWSASTGTCIRTLVGHEALVRALSFDPRSGRLVSASYDKTVKVWDLGSGKLVREFKNTHTSHIFDVKFDVARIVSTSHDHTIVVLDFSQGLDTSLFV